MKFAVLNSLMLAYFLCFIASTGLYAQKPAITTDSKQHKAASPAAQKPKEAHSPAKKNSVQPKTAVRQTISSSKTQGTINTARTTEAPKKQQASNNNPKQEATPQAPTKAIAPQSSVVVGLSALSSKQADSLVRLISAVPTDSLSSVEQKKSQGGSILTPSFTPQKDYWLLLPLCIILLLSIWYAESILPLLLAIIIGAWALNGFQLGKFFNSLQQIFDVHLTGVFTNTNNLYLGVFMLFMSAFSALSLHNGSVLGWVASMSSIVQTRRSAHFLAWFTAIFTAFDSLASANISGQIARPLNDHHKSSREKLAFIIHISSSTISIFVLFSTFASNLLPEIAKYSQQSELISPQSIYLYAFNYAFYPIFLLFLLVATIIWQRNIGFMHQAEQRAVTSGQLYKGNFELYGYNQYHSLENIDNSRTHTNPNGFYYVLPILAFICVFFFTLFKGSLNQLFSDKPTDVLQHLIAMARQADIAYGLLCAAGVALLCAMLLSLLSARLSISQTIESIIWGMKNAVAPILNLILAMTLLQIYLQLPIADFLVSFIPKYTLILPILAFSISAWLGIALGNTLNATLFSTAMFLPIALSYAYNGTFLPHTASTIFYGTLANCISGTLFGTHIAINSQGTIISAFAAQCPSTDHIKTQIPYAIIGAILNLIATSICLWFAISAFIPLIVGIVLIPSIVFFLGKKTIINTQNPNPLLNIEQANPILPETINSQSESELLGGLPVAAATYNKQNLYTESADEEASYNILSSEPNNNVSDAISQKENTDTTDFYINSNLNEAENLSDPLNEDNEEHIAEAVNRTKDMFQSMKSIIASISDEIPNNPSNNEENELDNNTYSNKLDDNIDIDTNENKKI